MGRRPWRTINSGSKIRSEFIIHIPWRGCKRENEHSMAMAIYQLSSAQIPKVSPLKSCPIPFPHGPMHKAFLTEFIVW